MDHNRVRRFSNENAQVWTQLSRAGYDVYRDHLNTPAFLEMLPDVAGLRGPAEAHRTLTAQGFLQFSITHPCYDTPHRRNLRDADGRTYAHEVGNYFTNLEGRLDEWIFSAAPQESRSRLPAFRIPRFTRTLSQWLNLILDIGFVLERIGEPCPSEETIHRHPSLQDAQVVAYFLYVRAHKRSDQGR